MNPTQLIQQQYLDPYRQSQLPGMPNYSTQMGHRVQNPQAAMMAKRYGDGQMGYQGVFANGTPTFGAYQPNPFAGISNINNLRPGGKADPFGNISNLMPGLHPSAARNVTARDGLQEVRRNPLMMHQNSRAEDGAAMLGNKFLAGNAGIGPDGGMSKWGSAAAKGLSNAKTFFGAMKPGSGSTVANAFGKASFGKPGGFMSKVGALPGWSMPVAAAAAFQVNKRLGQKAHQKDLARYQEQIRNTPTDQQHTLGPPPTHNRRGGLIGRLFKR